MGPPDLLYNQVLAIFLLCKHFGHVDPAMRNGSFHCSGLLFLFLTLFPSYRFLTLGGWLATILILSHSCASTTSFITAFSLALVLLFLSLTSVTAVRVLLYDFLNLSSLLGLLLFLVLTFALCLFLFLFLIFVSFFSNGIWIRKHAGFRTVTNSPELSVVQQDATVLIAAEYFFDKNCLLSLYGIKVLLRLIEANVIWQLDFHRSSDRHIFV